MYTSRVSQAKLRRYISTATTIILLVVIIGQHYGWFQAAAKQAVQNDPNLYMVDHFIDGDTISVKMNGKPQTVRFIGVDTPETHKPNTPVQCYGELAAAYTKAEISQHGNKVRLQADPQSDNRDVYGRLVRYVFLPNGQLLDALLVQNGYGFAYTYYPFTKSADFARDQDQAQSAHKGLWSSCRPYQETNGRWQTESAG